jgi:hypothetical protein
MLISVLAPMTPVLQIDINSSGMPRRADKPRGKPPASSFAAIY